MKAIGLGRRIMAKPENRVIKLLRLLIHPSALLYVLFPSKDSKYIIKKHYTKAISRLVHERNIDCLVCFKNPNDTLAGAIDAKTGVPIIAYELDPWENAEGKIDDNVREQQYSLEKHCAAIISTMLLYHSYFDDNCRIPTERVHCAEFPNIIEQKPLNKTKFSDGKIHCVFTGQLYEDIRNPKYTIELFSKLADENIELDIFGNDNGCLKEYTLPDNIVYHGEVTSEKAMEYILASDVVVNIGNTLMNQMPSKILTYIATGKPILNIIKDKDCPTMPYMDKYPLSVSILETEEPSAETVQKMKAFFLKSHGKQVGFKEIKKLYNTATPEYVGNQLLRIIIKSRDERANKGR